MYFKYTTQVEFCECKNKVWALECSVGMCMWVCMFGWGIWEGTCVRLRWDKYLDCSAGVQWVMEIGDAGYEDVKGFLAD